MNIKIQYMIFTLVAVGILLLINIILEMVR